MVVVSHELGLPTFGVADGAFGIVELCGCRDRPWRNVTSRASYAFGLVYPLRELAGIRGTFKRDWW